MSEPFVGEIRLFSFSRAPQGWALCDGQLLAVNQFDALFSLLGTSYGGDGRTTFGLPDLRGRVPMKFGDGPGLPGYAIGQSVGAEFASLTDTQLPAHNHAMFVANEGASATTPASNLQLGALNPDTMYVTDTSGLTSAAADPATLAPSGGGQSHDNLMPTLTVSYCIATVGIYPSRS